MALAFIYFTQQEKMKMPTIMRHKLESRQFLKAVGNKLQSLRQEQKKECEAVAKILKISPELLISIESGDYDLPLDVLIALCEVNEITLYFFFETVSNKLRGEWMCKIES